MAKQRGFAFVATLALAAAVVSVLSLESQAAPPKPPIDCSIVLCPAPPPTCPPGFKLGIPAGQCCPKCLPTK